MEGNGLLDGTGKTTVDNLLFDSSYLRKWLRLTVSSAGKVEESIVDRSVLLRESGPKVFEHLADRLFQLSKRHNLVLFSSMVSSVRKKFEVRIQQSEFIATRVPAKDWEATRIANELLPPAAVATDQSGALGVVSHDQDDGTGNDQDQSSTPARINFEAESGFFTHLPDRGAVLPGDYWSLRPLVAVFCPEQLRETLLVHRRSQRNLSALCHAEPLKAWSVLMHQDNEWSPGDKHSKHSWMIAEPSSEGASFNEDIGGESTGDGYSVRYFTFSPQWDLFTNQREWVHASHYLPLMDREGDDVDFVNLQNNSA